jgi:multidrug efflux pump subunit AcrA (membrane-fusion protein)
MSGANVAQSALTQAVVSENQIVAQIKQARSGRQQAQAQYRKAVAQKQSAHSQIKPGNLVKISFDGMPAVIQGKVDRVIPTANPNFHSLNVSAIRCSRITVPSP